jgi:hypothetical protein
MPGQFARGEGNRGQSADDITARRNNLNSDVKSIQESIRALRRGPGIAVQLDAVHRQIALLDEEIAS